MNNLKGISLYYKDRTHSYGITVTSPSNSPKQSTIVQTWLSGRGRGREVQYLGQTYDIAGWVEYKREHESQLHVVTWLTGGHNLLRFCWLVNSSPASGIQRHLGRMVVSDGHASIPWFTIRGTSLSFSVSKSPQREGRGGFRIPTWVDCPNKLKISHFLEIFFKVSVLP